MNLLHAQTRRAVFLARLRRRLRHFWLLHFVLIASLLLLPAARVARADDEEEFTLTSNESAVSVNVWASEGTSGMAPGASRQLTTSVQLNTWEVWTGSVSGGTQIRNPLTTSMPSASLSFSASGGGAVSPGSATTDGSGLCVASFTMGSAASTVTVTESSYGATGTLTFDNPVIPETWEWDHDESLITASLSPGSSTENVPSGATQAVQAHVEITHWSVYVSSLGNTKTDNSGTSPAIGALLSWSIASGDGTLGSASSSTDDSGNASASFTMGAAASIVRVDVSYASASSKYATLQFNPASVEETWMLDHVESATSGLTLGANGSTDSLNPGTQRDVTATVTQDSHEVWVSNLGNTENRNYMTTPAPGASVSFSISSGDGTLSGYSGTTDSNGKATVTFTMGSQASAVGASCEGFSDSIGFYPGVETWTYDHSESALTFSGFTAAGGTDNLRPGNTRTLTATVMNETWDVYVSNYGNTDNRNDSMSPALGVSVGFSVSAGDGQLSAYSSTTDSSGQAAVGFTMGSTASTVQADVNDGTHPAISTSLTLSLGAPEWHYDHTESTIYTSLSADGTTDLLQPGTNRTVTANVTYNSWEVWMDDTGYTENRNDSSGGASGAYVYFSVTQGDGTISTNSGYTDSNGNVSTGFTMGALYSIVQGDASYTGASSSSGTISFTRDPWHYDHSESALSLSLSADESTSKATAHVELHTWDVYADDAGNYEDRNDSAGPLCYHDVNFSSDGDVTLGSSTSPTTSATVQTNYNGDAEIDYACADDGEGNINADTQVQGPPPASASDSVPVKGPTAPKYTVKLLVSMPPATAISKDENGDDVLNIAAASGHAWIILLKDGMEVDKISYGPAPPVNGANAMDLLNGTGIVATATYAIGVAHRSKEFPITSEEAKKLGTAMTDFKAAVPKYTATNNCASVPLDLMKKASITNLPDGKGKVGYPVDLSDPNSKLIIIPNVVTPYHLGKQLDPAP